MGTQKGNRPPDLSRGDRPRLSVIERHNLTGEDFTSVLLATCNAAPTFAGMVFGRLVGMRGRPRTVSCYSHVQLNGQPNSRVPDGLVELTDRWGRRRRLLLNVERGHFNGGHEDELRQELDIVRKVKLDRLVGVAAVRPSDEYKKTLVSRWSPLAVRQVRFLSWMEIWLSAEKLLDDEYFVRTSEAQIVYEFYDFFRRRAYKLLSYQPFGANLMHSLEAGQEDNGDARRTGADTAIFEDWKEFVRFSSLRLRLPQAKSWPDVTLFDTQTAEAQLASNRQLCARIDLPNWQEAIYLALDFEAKTLTMQAKASVPLYAQDLEKAREWLKSRLPTSGHNGGTVTDVRFDFATGEEPIILPVDALFARPEAVDEVELDSGEDIMVEETGPPPILKSAIIERTISLSGQYRAGRELAEFAEREIRAFHVYLRRVMK